MSSLLLWISTVDLCTAGTSYWPLVYVYSSFVVSRTYIRRIARSLRYIVAEREQSVAINFHIPLSLLPRVESQVRPKSN